MTGGVSALKATAVLDVVDVLHESFFDYPVMRFVVGDEEAPYDRRLRTLVHFFVMARGLRNEALLGIHAADELVGTALISRPDGPGAPPEFYELRDEVWSSLGEGAAARYVAFGEALSPFEVDAPYLHLNMIGVRRRV